MCPTSCETASAIFFAEPTVAILFLRSEGTDVRDAAASVADSADNDANRVGRRFKDRLIGRNGNVVRRVVFLDAKDNLVDVL